MVPLSESVVERGISPFGGESELKASSVGGFECIDASEDFDAEDGEACITS